MDKPETVATLVTQDTGRRQTEYKLGPNQNPGVNSGARE